MIQTNDKYLKELADADEQRREELREREARVCPPQPDPPDDSERCEQIADLTLLLYGVPGLMPGLVKERNDYRLRSVGEHPLFRRECEQARVVCRLAADGLGPAISEAMKRLEELRK